MKINYQEYWEDQGVYLYREKATVVIEAMWLTSQIVTSFRIIFWSYEVFILLAEDDEGEFYYDGEEALGAGALDNRVLDHLDSLLTMPRADDLDEVISSL